MKMKTDTKTHLQGGTFVLLMTLWLSLALLALGLHPLTVCLALAGLVAGACVEGTQWADNRNAAKAGLPAPHEVSWRDLRNSALPCWIAAAAAESLARHGVLAWVGL